MIRNVHRTFLDSGSSILSDVVFRSRGLRLPGSFPPCNGNDTVTHQAPRRQGVVGQTPGQTPIGVNFASPEQCSGPISGAVANRVSNRQGSVSAKLTLIGQTPWSARDALVPQPEQRYQHPAKREQAD